MNNQEPKVYIENIDHQYKLLRLNDGEYAKAIQSLVVVCTDIVIINIESKKIYLAKRKAMPASGWWWFIGGRSYVGETPHKSMQRCFKRETSLMIDESRFEYISMNRYFFADRQQKPHDVGCDSLSYVYSLKLSENEIKAIKLDSNEYMDNDLTGFNLQELQSSEAVHDPIIDIYRDIFKK